VHVARKGFLGLSSGKLPAGTAEKTRKTLPFSSVRLYCSIMNAKGIERAEIMADWYEDIDAELEREEAMAGMPEEWFCEHESETPANGHGSYCRHCGETLA
jgi:hypothetical protein